MGEVIPVEIILLDQTNLPVASPVLQLLFARDGLVRRSERLDVDEAMHLVFLDEFGAATCAMLFEADTNIIGEPMYSVP